MKVGIVVPQGWTGEYEGVAPADAWARTIEIAQRAERLGFESLWLFDHVHTTPDPREIPHFEAFTALTALAMATSRPRLGHLVSCTAFRNPALHAKMISTMDVISGGRMDLGIGAGWKREEWEAYGWDFPETRARLQRLEESLQIITRMLHQPGRATWQGDLVRVEGAINEPKPLQEHLPIMVGGNGRQVTWRIAAQFADELNLDAMPAAEWLEARPELDRHLDAAGRDRNSMRVSVHLWWQHLDEAPSRAEVLREYADAGIDRVMTLVRSAAQDPDEIDRFAEDCREAGVELTQMIEA
jgi:F420-dependent oxidoreductase-like protein